MIRLVSDSEPVLVVRGDVEGAREARIDLHLEARMLSDGVEVRDHNVELGELIVTVHAPDGKAMEQRFVRADLSGNETVDSEDLGPAGVPLPAAVGAELPPDEEATVDISESMDVVAAYIASKSDPPKAESEYRFELLDETQSDLERPPILTPSEPDALRPEPATARGAAPHLRESWANGTELRTVRARYLLIGKLGASPHSESHLAYEIIADALPRPVAVKRLLADGEDWHGRRQRFMDRCRIGAELDHPNISPVIDWGEHHGVPFLVRPAVDGLNIRALTAFSETKLAISSVVEIMRQLTAALAYLHGGDAASPSIVHGELCPSSIIVGRDGVARLTEPAASTVAELGAFASAAPELIVRGPFDGRADLFALGVAMVELLSGTSLAPNGRLDYEHLAAEIGARTAAGPDVPPELAGLLAAMTAVAIEDRPSRTETVLSIIEDLAASLEPAKLREVVDAAFVRATPTASSAPGTAPPPPRVEAPPVRPSTQPSSKAPPMRSSPGLPRASMPALPAPFAAERSPPGGLPRTSVPSSPEAPPPAGPPRASLPSSPGLAAGPAKRASLPSSPGQAASASAPPRPSASSIPAPHRREPTAVSRHRASRSPRAPQSLSSREAPAPRPSRSAPEARSQVPEARSSVGQWALLLVAVLVIAALTFAVLLAIQ